MTYLMRKWFMNKHSEAWCQLKGHTYLNKPAAESCVKVWPFSGHQALRVTTFNFW